MTQWVYKIVEFRSMPDLRGILSNYGGAGWELASIWNGHAVFKQPLEGQLAPQLRGQASQQQGGMGGMLTQQGRTGEGQTDNSGGPPWPLIDQFLLYLL